MKITPEQPTHLIQQHSTFRLPWDKGACCFFILGIFLAAMIFHLLGIFPTV
ncbi:hypothetical protein [Acinetobacter defluvii]|uniref:hypothetical protein n=1 Tax=Acinetobacter defluvii TaxID=1871111 RepID=UPI00148F39E8|nr:hypothetical protein [Acinetobacter defluvii]